MTDTTPDAGGTPPAPAPKPAAKDEAPKRYAAYDKDLLRFVGGVHDTKAKARDAAKDRGVKNYETREV